MLLLFAIMVAVAERPLFGKELFVRFTVRVFREHFSNFVCVLFSLLVGGCGL